MKNFNKKLGIMMLLTCSTMLTPLVLGMAVAKFEDSVRVVRSNENLNITEDNLSGISVEEFMSTSLGKSILPNLEGGEIKDVKVLRDSNGNITQFKAVGNDGNGNKIEFNYDQTVRNEIFENKVNPNAEVGQKQVAGEISLNLEKVAEHTVIKLEKIPNIEIYPEQKVFRLMIKKREHFFYENGREVMERPLISNDMLRARLDFHKLYKRIETGSNIKSFKMLKLLMNHRQLTQLRLIGMDIDGKEKTALLKLKPMKVKGLMGFKNFFNSNPLITLFDGNEEMEYQGESISFDPQPIVVNDYAERFQESEKELMLDRQIGTAEGGATGRATIAPEPAPLPAPIPPRCNRPGGCG